LAGSADDSEEDTGYIAPLSGIKFWGENISGFYFATFNRENYL
jgi:hypothetical protein